MTAGACAATLHGARELERGALHIWSAGLDGPGARGVSALSSDELERARRIVRPQARRRWMAARSFLRSLLGAYVGADPGSLRFSAEDRGKPALAGDGAADLRFSLSHSGPVAVCALTRTCAVGVDVQVPARRANVRAAALRAFGPQQAERLCRLPPDRLEWGFLRAWVRLEAESKRVGLGLAGLSEHVSGPRAWLVQLELGPLGLRPLQCESGDAAAGESPEPARLEREAPETKRLRRAASETERLEEREAPEHGAVELVERQPYAAAAVALALPPTDLRYGTVSDYWIHSE